MVTPAEPPNPRAPNPRALNHRALNHRVLNRRALSLATLARQFLLTRQEIGVTDAMERLAGLNAQDPRPPYLSLWARLDGFARDDLTRLLYDRTVVRSSLLRGTQHMAIAPRLTRRAAACSPSPRRRAGPKSASYQPGERE